LAKPNTHIVKRALHYTEPYDERKLYASVYAACLSVRTPAGEAELTADRVCRTVEPWLEDKSEVTSGDIRLHVHAASYNRIGPWQNTNTTTTLL